MLDIKRIRNNPEEIKKKIKTRNANLDNLIDEVLELDELRRKLISEAESMKAQQNGYNKKIPAMKKAGEDTTEIMKDLKQLSKNISEKNKELSEIEHAEKLFGE